MTSRTIPAAIVVGAAVKVDDQVGVHPDHLVVLDDGDRLLEWPIRICTRRENGRDGPR